MNLLFKVFYIIYKLIPNSYKKQFVSLFIRSTIRSILLYMFRKFYVAHQSVQIKIGKVNNTITHNKNNQTLISLETENKFLLKIFGNYEYTTNVYKTNLENIAITSCTLPNNNKYVFYIGGSNDYFYNVELSKLFLDSGYDFYSFDTPNCGFAQNNLANYNDFSNINQLQKYALAAINLIDSNYSLVSSRILCTHSRGVLLGLKLIDHNKTLFNKLICNSPFLQIDEQNKLKRYITNPFFFIIGLMFPQLKIKSDEYKLNRTVYSTIQNLYPYGLNKKDVETIVAQYNIDPKKKFDKKYNNHEIQKGRYILFEPVYLRTYYMYYETQQLLKLKKYNIPTLVLICDKTVLDNIIEIGDYVLDVNNIQKKAKKLFTNLQLETIPNSNHDIYASNEEAKQKAFDFTRKFL
jgi:alpha-beta hydrolase superfamily lysophospholipase